MVALQRQLKDMKELMLSFDVKAKREEDPKWRHNADEIRPAHQALSEFVDAAEILVAEAAAIPEDDADDDMMKTTRQALAERVVLAEKHMEGGKISLKRWKGVK